MLSTISVSQTLINVSFFSNQASQAHTNAISRRQKKNETPRVMHKSLLKERVAFAKFSKNCLPSAEYKIATLNINLRVACISCCCYIPTHVYVNILYYLVFYYNGFLQNSRCR